MKKNINMSAPIKYCFYRSYATFLRCKAFPDNVRRFSTSLSRCNPWQLTSAVCLERPAVITTPLSDSEHKYAELLNELEQENSLMCDHELRDINDRKLQARRKQDDFEETEVILQTAQEQEDEWDKYHSTFTAQSRVTDSEHDKSTHDRKLDRKLFLLVKQKLGDESHWTFPLSPLTEGESMRQAAERALVEHCGSDISAQFLGNAPAGYLKYKYVDQKVQGSKVFFFKALHNRGDVTLSPTCQEHAWVTKEELAELVSPTLRKEANKFLLDL